MSIIGYDIGFNDEGEFLVENGDFKIIDSNTAHAKSITQATKGDWKMNPEIGCDLLKYLNGSGSNESTILYQIIRKQLENDGFKVQDLTVEHDLSTDKLSIKTNAIRIR
jgi:NurA-like 5'-3' nuclease